MNEFTPEIWKPINLFFNNDGYPLYEVSNIGRVVRIEHEYTNFRHWTIKEKEKLMPVHKNSDGLRYVLLSSAGSVKSVEYSVDVLIEEAFK